MSMKEKQIYQIILGNLEKVGLSSDDILISELSSEREGNYSFFHVRKLHGGLYSSLGYWRMNLNTGEISGIAKNLSSLNKLSSVQEYHKEFENIRALETVFRTYYDRPAKMIERYSAENITSIGQLLSPINYLRKTLQSLVQKAIKPRHTPLYEKEYIGLPEQYSTLLCDDFDLKFYDEITTILRDLSSYSTKAKKSEKIVKEDIDDAYNFLKAFLIIIKQWFLDLVRSDVLLSDDEYNNIKLISAFTQWRAYRRLPPRYKTPKILFTLLVQNACIHYAMDNFPEKIEDAKKYFCVEEK